MRFDLIKGLNQLYILGQHELVFQFGENDPQDVRDGGIIQF